MFEDIFNWIVKYWLEAVMGGMISILALWCKRLSMKVMKEVSERCALKSGMIAMLHDKLFKICKDYLTLGYIPLDDSEEILDNARIVYEAYHALGGNGTGTEIYNKFKKLHIKPKED